MEPINFASVLRRSWRLLLVLAVIGAVIGAVLPLTHVKQPKPVLHWKSSAVLGAAPKGGGGLGTGVTSSQLVFYGNTLAVQQGAVKQSGQNIPYFFVSKYMQATLGEGKSSTPTKGKRNVSPFVTLTAYGKSKADAIALANSYSTTLRLYVQAQVYAHDQNLTQQKSAQKPTTPAGSGTTTTTTTTTPAPSGSRTYASLGGVASVDTGVTEVSGANSATRVHPSTGGKLNSHKVRALVGFIVGLILGALIAISRVMLDKRLRTAGQAASSFGYPVIVEILARPPLSADERAAPIDVSLHPGSVEAESYRMLRMSVLFEALGGTAGATADPFGLPFGGNGHGAYGGTSPVVPDLVRRDHDDRQIVLVVSPEGEESRPMVAANLAAVCAEAGQRVIVASTAPLGVGRPERMDNVGGLFTGDIRPVDVGARLGPTRVDNVVQLPFTLFLQNSGQLVSRGRELLEAARSVSDVIIVETPGLLSVHHAEALSRAVDVVIIVGECGATRIADAKRSSELLRRVGAPVLGVALTNVRPTGRSKRSRAVAPIGPIAVPVGVPASPPPLSEVGNAVGSDEPTAKTQV